MGNSATNRRAVLLGLGAVTVGAAAGVGAQAPAATTPFTPALHEADAWMSAMGGRHRVVLDVVTPEHVPDAIRFSGNILNAHKTAYGVEEADVAVLICLRHSATRYGYGDAVWSKYGKVLDAAATPAPTANPYQTTGRTQLGDLAARGVRFMVCGTASRGLATRIAGQGGDVDAVLKEMGGGLIPNARIVAAGVVGVMHAQERGFSLIAVG